MTPIFKKLQLKTEGGEILVLNAPESFEPELAELMALTNTIVARDPDAIEKTAFGLAFAITQAELDAALESLVAKVQGDALLWVAYPKKSSKKYTCEFNRDTGWGVLGDAGYEPVRIVAIDADWSALRFRHTNFIKTLKRSNKMAISAEGKKRTAKK